MFKSFGLPELLAILALVILLFGVGRIGKIAKELGSGIRSFKKGINGEEDEEESKDEPTGKEKDS